MSWMTRPEGGSYLAIRSLVWLAQHLGRVLVRPLLIPITLYFVIRRAAERQASMAYLARVLPRAPRMWDVARHIHVFASTILDRVYFLLGQSQRFNIRLHGLPMLEAAIAQGGVLLMGSHLGSFEALRALARNRPDIGVRVVLDRSISPTIMRVLEELDPGSAQTVIDGSSDGMAIVLAMRDALEQGIHVTLLADRVKPGEAAVEVDFLGQPAPFPASPWLLAAALRAPVVLCFGLYRGGNRYDLVFEHFADRIELPRQHRADALQSLVERYSARLEEHVRTVPLNWFNFYDFWQPGFPVGHLRDGLRQRGMGRTADGDPTARQTEDRQPDGQRHG